MTTIKEEILKEFDRNWIKPWKDNNFGVPNAHFTIKDFLIQSIDKVVEEEKSKFITELNKIKDIADGCIYVGKENVKKLEAIREVLNNSSEKDHNLSVKSNE